MNLDDLWVLHPAMCVLLRETHRGEDTEDRGRDCSGGGGGGGGVRAQDLQGNYQKLEEVRNKFSQIQVEYGPADT